MTNLRAAARITSNLPTLSQSQIAKRWQMDADTVRNIIRKHHLSPVPAPWKRARYSILDIWRVEGVSHASALDLSQHSDLLEPLATANDLAKLYNCTPATIRNWARESVLPSFRLGGSVRFHMFAIQEVLSEF
ncbi:helix-turn-helix domain-containing protein [Falsihalocynthiibacter arcticus]|nr:helix-turn-helix domain-containing protein [Falsihalocynthiibacter arcticus]